MSTRTHFIVVVGALVTLAVIFRLVRVQQLRSKYALLWLVIALALVPIAVFPGLLEWTSDRLGIEVPANTLLFAACAFLFAVAVHYSWEISRLETRTRLLAEEVALLRTQLGPAAAEARTPDARSTDTQPPIVDGEHGARGASG
jgi:hypothetical protein